MDTLIMLTWQEIVDDPTLRNLPYKIEQDRHGRIVMSPARPQHTRYQMAIGALLRLCLPGWAIYGECGIETSGGVRVPDVAATPEEKARLYAAALSLPEAPELCIEVLSWSNSGREMDEKRRLYAERGCREFWICSPEGEMTFFDAASGQKLARSVLCPEFPSVVRI